MQLTTDRLSGCARVGCLIVGLVICVYWGGAFGGEPEPDNELIVVTVTGLGTDSADALTNAFYRAVEQAVGMVVDAETLVENNEVVRDKVLTFSNAIVRGYDVLREEELPNGLHQTSIRAEVQRRQLVQRLIAADIEIKQVDTTSVYAEIASELMAQQDSAALLEKVLEELNFPVDYLRVRLVNDHPEILESSETDATIQWHVEIHLDRDAYFENFLPRIQPVLAEIATERTSSAGVVCQGQAVRSAAGTAFVGAFIHEPLSFVSGESLLEVGLAPSKIALLTNMNSSTSNMVVVLYTLDEKSLETIRSYFTPGEGSRPESRRLPQVRLDFLDSNGNFVRAQSINLSSRHHYQFGYFENSTHDPRKSNLFFLAPLVGAEFTPRNLRYSTTFRMPIQQTLPLEELREISSIQVSLLSDF